MSVTPQNQSSDSESGDDDVVRNLPANLHLTSAAHITASSPDDREPPTPTIPQVKMQPPTPVNNAREEESSRRLSTSPVPNERAISAGRHDEKRSMMSTGDDHADAVVVRHIDQESVGDSDDPHSDHHARPEDGLASTPRPRAILDRDTEPSRHLPPGSLSHPPHSDSPARKPPVTNLRRSGGVQDRPQQLTLSVHPVPQFSAHITSDPPPGPRADNNPQVRDQNTMTQVSKDLPGRVITNPPCVIHIRYSFMLRVFPCNISNNINNTGHQLQPVERIHLSALLRVRHIIEIRLNTWPQPSDPKPDPHHFTLSNKARVTILLPCHALIRSSVDHLR